MFLKRLPVVVLLLVIAASAAQAYTIVMKDGRRVEIPNQFTITKSTLTYEVSAGFQITIQLATVDVAATERANGQPKGSLLLISAVPKVRTIKTELRPKAERSITNTDLESYRKARVENEQAYEKRRKELGLPSLEERRREIAAIEERTQQQLLSMRSQEESSEEYWRERAAPLRAEIAATQAQIDFVRRRLDELPPTFSFGAFSTTIPFGTVGPVVTGFPFQNLITPNVFAPSIVGSGFNARVGFNSGSNFGRGNSPGMINRGRFGHGGLDGRRFPPFSRGSLLAIPFQSYDYGFERSELASQLNQLLMTQAGLRARWRELEEEARKAGAYPGWLR
jgi:hypothetical protein